MTRLNMILPAMRTVTGSRVTFPASSDSPQSVSNFALISALCQV